MRVRAIAQQMTRKPVAAGEQLVLRMRRKLRAAVVAQHENAYAHVHISHTYTHTHAY
jgi:hypothetical protein